MESTNDPTKHPQDDQGGVPNDGHIASWNRLSFMSKSQPPETSGQHTDGCDVPPNGERDYLRGETRYFLYENNLWVQPNSGPPIKLLPDEYGLPVVEKVVLFTSKERSWPPEKYYSITYAGATNHVPAKFVQDGTYWGYFVGGGLIGRRNASVSSSLIQHLSDTPAIPHLVADGTSGWVFGDKAAYILPDGSAILSTGRVRDYTEPAVNVDDAELYTEVTDDVTATGDAILGALSWCRDISPDGVMLASLLAGVRSLLWGIARTDTVLVLSGRSGLGKTSAASFARNLVGAFYRSWKDPTASFRDTITSIELCLGSLSSLPVVLDDLVVQPGATQGELSELRDKLDRFVRSVHGGSAVRRRATRTLQQQRTWHVRLLPIVTGESLPAIADSCGNRFLELRLEGDGSSLDVSRLAGESDIHARAILALGHNLIKWAVGWAETDLAGFREWLRQEYGGCVQLLSDLIESRIGRPLSEMTRRLPEHAGHIMVGAKILKRYASSLGWPQPTDEYWLAERLVDHILVQAQWLESGCAGDRDHRGFSEWTCSVIRRKLSEQRWHTRFHDNKALIENEGLPVPLTQLGYRERKDIDGNSVYEPIGRPMAWLSHECNELLFHPDDLYAELRSHAAHDKRSFPDSPRLLWGRLAEEGIITIETLSSQRHLTVRRRVGGRQARYVAFKNEFLFGDWTDESDYEEGSSDDADDETNVRTVDAKALVDVVNSPNVPLEGFLRSWHTTVQGPRWAQDLVPIALEAGICLEDASLSSDIGELMTRSGLLAKLLTSLINSAPTPYKVKAEGTPGLRCFWSIYVDGHDTQQSSSSAQ